MADGTSGLHQAAAANTTTREAGICAPCGGPCTGQCKFKPGSGTVASGGESVFAEFPEAPAPKPFRIGQGG